MKILHVDDNESITGVFGKILTVRKHEYTSINESKKGLEVLLADEYDLAFLDLSMPGLSGFEVLEEMEKKNVGRDNIIVMTAATLSNEEKSKLTNYGIKSILFKPVNLKKILDEVNSIRPKEETIRVN